MFLINPIDVVKHPVLASKYFVRVTVMPTILNQNIKRSIRKANKEN